MPKILADESVDFRIVKKLIHEGHNVVSVLKDYQGIPDKQVIELAKRLNSLLLTEDSDFGEWVFAHKERGVSVIFLRYKSEQWEDIASLVIKVISKYGDSLFGKFVVITVRKIRIREIL